MNNEEKFKFDVFIFIPLDSFVVKQCVAESGYELSQTKECLYYGE